MTILRFEPPIELDTPKGKGWAIFLRDYGFDHDDLWTVIISANSGNLDVSQQRRARHRERDVWRRVNHCR